jgi:ATP synthase protein I
VARPDPERFRKWGALAGIGPLLAAAIVVGYFVGGWVDRRFGTAPWGMAAGLFLGAAGGFVELFRLLREAGDAGGARGRRRPGGGAGRGSSGGET